MTRAAILIGVRSVAGLAPLCAVFRGVQSMASWAESQGFSSVKVLIDETDPVHAHHVSEAVFSIVDAGTTEQLVVYFAGHGLNKQGSEFWLLSDAPRNTAAAVNVEGSARLARSGGIPHVVFFSDTCRTLPRSQAEQAMRGTDVFPADFGGGPARWVDMFFACGLGSPAFETARSGVYTDSLVWALGGHVPGILERGNEPDGSTRVLRPWPLHWHLVRDVERRLAEEPSTRMLTQEPEARICSPETAWLSKVASLQSPEDPPCLGDYDSPDAPGPIVRSDRERHATRWGSPGSAARDARDALVRMIRPVRSAADLDRVGDPWPSWARTEAEAHARRFTQSVQASDAALQILGARLIRADSSTADVVLDGTDGSADVTLPPGTDAADVVVSVGRAGGVFPVLRDFRTTLIFERGELVDLAVEPCVRSTRYEIYATRRRDLRTLAALASTATRGGALTVSQEEATWWAARIRVGDMVDPALAVLASYVWDSLNLRDQVEYARAALADRLGLRLFDLELLADGATRGAHPGRPLLGRGWALLDTIGHADDLTNALRPHLLPSMWTLFDDTGVGILRDAVPAGR